VSFANIFQFELTHNLRQIPAQCVRNLFTKETEASQPVIATSLPESTAIDLNLPRSVSPLPYYYMPTYHPYPLLPTHPLQMMPLHTQHKQESGLCVVTKPPVESSTETVNSTAALRMECENETECHVLTVTKDPEEVNK
jgi:hypothetical protein